MMRLIYLVEWKVLKILSLNFKSICISKGWRNYYQLVISDKIANSIFSNITSNGKLIDRVRKSKFKDLKMNSPKVFISYAWESDDVKEWVKNLAIQLRKSGVDVKLDQWEIAPGDQMPHFMEKSVRDNDYVMLICTPKYKLKSENRIGGVGYEGDIMTAEVLQSSNHRKFIPILQSGAKDVSIPTWLKGKYFIDLSNDLHFTKNFKDLITTVLNARETAPQIGQIPSKFQNQLPSDIKNVNATIDEKIRIKGIIVDEVTEPLNDGTRGSGLYKIPFELNKRATNDWIELFIHAFNRPAQFTQMHRPNIASVHGNKIYLDGTTIEEVERYHKRTLKLAVEAANKAFEEIQITKMLREDAERKQREEHKKNIDDINKRINFDVE